jgi:lysophospholipase L1-like esterase
MRNAMKKRLFWCLAAAVMGGVLGVSPVWGAKGAAAPDELLTLGLLSLEAGRGGTVRVIHFGDSHIAGEDESSVVRAYLAGLFGDGGPGYFLPWTAPKYYRRLGVSTGSTPLWRRVLPSRYAPPDDAGLSGCYMEAMAVGQRAWAVAPFDSFRVYLLRQPGGGSAEIAVDGSVLATEDLSSQSCDLAIVSKKLTPSAAARRLEVRIAGNGKVRILGVSLERAGGGVTYSPLGILGARADILLKNRPETFGRLLKAESPDLVILGYGTNESGDRPFDSEGYIVTLDLVLSYIKKAVPGASILVLGPPDRAERAGSLWKSLPSLSQVAEAQRKAAKRTGASFLDLRAAMGGEGSVNRWAEAKPPLAQGDRVHFTSAGYALLGQAVARDLVDRYNREKSSSAIRKRLEGADGSEILLSKASRPTVLPGQPPASFALASAQRMDEPSDEEPPHEVFYFRDAKGVLVITDDPSYGAGSEVAGSSVSAAPKDSSGGVYYFEKPDGTLVVTSDKSSVEGEPGRFLSPDEVRTRPGRSAPKGGSR